MASMKSYVDVLLSPSTQQYISNSTLIGIWWNKASKAFWRPDFWLPLGLEWEDLVDTEELRYPNFYDVCVYPLIFGVLLLLVRNFILVPFLLDPLAQLAGIPNKQHRPPKSCPALEAVYLRYKKKPSKEVLMKASSSTGMSTRQVERWLRRRHVCTETTTYMKFIGSGFHLICHTYLTAFGLMVLWTKPWLWDISETWKDYPHQHVDDDMWWYYIKGLSYYWTSTFIQVQSPGRSTYDKVQMMLHHLFTILLMMFSWTSNFIRSGSLVLLVHEISDVPLLCAKMCTYADTKRAPEVLFVVFILSWAVTRCYLYPFWIMKEVFLRTEDYFHTPAFNLQYGLVCGLLGINIVWTVLIGRVVKRKLTAGALEDVRSDGEELSDDEDSGDANKKKDD